MLDLKPETCVSCEHVWIPRKVGVLPTSCPRCKARHKPRRVKRKVLTCLRCDHQWNQRSELAPLKCPKCGDPWDRLPQKRRRR